MRAIIFDFDNTLGNRYASVYRAFREYLRLNSELDPHSLLFETVVQDFCVWDEAGAGNKKDMLAKIKDKYGIELDYRDFRKWWEDNQNSYAACFPGAKELLERLKGKYLLGCITNGEANAQTMKLKNAGIFDMFDRIIISGSEKFAKPEKKIFTEMAQRLGVQPSECIFIGDSFSLDIQGALNAGYDAIWICRNPYQPCDYNVRRIADISQLEEIL